MSTACGWEALCHSLLLHAISCFIVLQAVQKPQCKWRAARRVKNAATLSEGSPQKSGGRHKQEWFEEKNINPIKLNQFCKKITHIQKNRRNLAFFTSRVKWPCNKTIWVVEIWPCYSWTAQSNSIFFLSQTVASDTPFFHLHHNEKMEFLSLLLIFCVLEKHAWQCPVLSSSVAWYLLLFLGPGDLHWPSWTTFQKHLKSTWPNLILYCSVKPEQPGKAFLPFGLLQTSHLRTSVQRGGFFVHRLPDTWSSWEDKYCIWIFIWES